MKVVRRYATASRLAGGKPILQVSGPNGGVLFVVFDSKLDEDQIGKFKVSIVRSGQYLGETKLQQLLHSKEDA